MIERDFIELFNSLKRLKLNNDFKKLILDDYFIKETLEKAEAYNKDVSKRDEVLESITGINMLKKYFQKVENLAASKELQMEEE